jgi:hypothetical protein
MVITVRPKANDTPSNPIPTLGNAAAKTALPHPPRTNQKVPINSAPYFFIVFSLSVDYLWLTIPEIMSDFHLKDDGQRQRQPDEQRLSEGVEQKNYDQDHHPEIYRN